jgi:hypothetical protein
MIYSIDIQRWPNNALQPTATALAVLRMIILHFHPFGFAQPQLRASWLWLSLIR